MEKRAEYSTTPEPTLVEIAREMERAAAERVPTDVLAALSAHYGPGELAEWLRAGEAVHRKRQARFHFRRARQAGATVEEAKRAVAEHVHRSEAWVDRLVYPRS